MTRPWPPSARTSASPAAIARAVTYWWLYAFAPLLLPLQFPTVLPLEKLLRSARAARLFWAVVTLLLLRHTALETIAALGPGLGGVSGLG